MLTQMYVGAAMACTHDDAPLSKRISPMFRSAVHKWHTESMSPAGDFLHGSLRSDFRPIDRCDTATRGISAAGRRDQRPRLSESEGRHPAVDRFVPPGGHEVRLVPDADIATAFAHSLVERNPGRPVLAILAARVRFELIERAPVLHDHLQSDNCSEKSRFR